MGFALELERFRGKYVRIVIEEIQEPRGYIRLWAALPLEPR